MASVGSVAKPQGRVMPVLRKAARTAVLALPTVVTGGLYCAGARLNNLPLLRRAKSGLQTLYGSTMVSGLWTGYEVSKQNAAANGIDPQKAGMAYYLTGAAGIFGAKALGVAMGTSTWGDGGIWYGGALGGLAALAIFSKAAKISFLKLADSLTPGGLIGLGIGRLGCWTFGCCAGEIFGLHLEPFATIFNIGLGLWLNKMSQNISGKILALGTGIYGIIRFITEFSRHEYEKSIVFANLTLSQIISLLFVTTALALYAKFKKAPAVENPKPVQQTPKQELKQSSAELFAFTPLLFAEYKTKALIKNYNALTVITHAKATTIIFLINFFRTVINSIRAIRHWIKNRKSQIM